VQGLRKYGIISKIQREDLAKCISFKLMKKANYCADI